MPGESRAGVEEPVYKELLLLVCYGLTTPPESVRRGASAINPAGRQAGIPWVAFLSTRSSPEVGPQAPLIRAHCTYIRPKYFRSIVLFLASLDGVAAMWHARRAPSKSHAHSLSVQ